MEGYQDIVTSEYLDNFNVHTRTYTHLLSPHSAHSLQIPTDVVFYNEWRALIVKRLGEEGERMLTNRVEQLA
jgi:hypothetical protein